MDFTFSNTPKIIFGEGRLEQITSYISKFGNKTLVITGKSFPESVYGQKFFSKLKKHDFSYIHEVIHGEPTPEHIDNIKNNSIRLSPNVVVAIGGGSIMDAGKAVSAMLCEDGPITDFLEGVGTKQPSGIKVPLITVPTTSGTGSEATKNAVITQYGKNAFKKSLRHDNFVPDIALIDPNLTITCPPEVTASSGMDAFTQLFESYLSTNASSLTNALAFDGIKHIFSSLQQAVTNGNDIISRTGMSYAALLSGITLANAGLGVIHGFAQPLGSLFPIPHGVVCANLMGPANQITVEKLRSENDTETLKNYANIAHLLYPDMDEKEATDKLLQYINQLTKKFNIPKISSFGVNSTHYDTIINSTGLKNHPVKLNQDELKMILENAG
ncbi:MAG: iron-containing alcohol dehydrogenase [Prolixibacteraceae bacterium]|nr:iron-containing alcohol dehydrogenase [Prolixibacteraceae bacterium]